MRGQVVRVSAIAAVVGAVLALVGNLLHPRTGDDSDLEAYRRFARSTSLRVADLILIVASIMFVQTDSGSQDVAFLVGSLLVTVWFLCAGGWLLRPGVNDSAPA